MFCVHDCHKVDPAEAGQTADGGAAR
jgi:hypothetical protein